MSSKGYDAKRDPNLAELDPVEIETREAIERCKTRLISLDGVEIDKKADPHITRLLRELVESVLRVELLESLKILKGD